MDISKSKNTVAGLLSIEKTSTYRVPHFQRSYSWSLSNWNDLFDDINENERGHFIGSIICIAPRSEPDRSPVYEIIDGQQRLTTISILFAALCDCLITMQKKTESISQFDEEDKKELSNLIDGIRKRLAVTLGKYDEDKSEAIRFGADQVKLRVLPATQNKNCEDYCFILCDSNVINVSCEAPKYFGNRLMARSYSHYKDTLKELNFKQIRELVKKVEALQLVYISTDSHADAFKLFESLNNRGAPLTALDIIKNKLLMGMSNKGLDVYIAYEQWQDIINPILGVEDRYLRQFYNAFKNNLDVTHPKYSKATQSSLIDIYEFIVDRIGPEKTFDELREKAKLYARFINPDESYEKHFTVFIGLLNINAAPVYTFLLYLFSLDSDVFENDESIRNILEFLKKYYIRRNVTDQPRTRDLDQLQIDLIKACEKRIKEGKLITEKFIIENHVNIENKPATLEELKNKLKGDIYLENRQMARYLLTFIDESAHSREYKPDFWERNTKKSYVWTIEHILPQKENMSDGWVEMLAESDKELAQDIHAKHVHKLGNLTLSAYNSKLSDAEFHVKQELNEPTINSKKISIGYKNKLHLNCIQFCLKDKEYTLANVSEWNKETIESRTDAMVTELIKKLEFINY